MRYLIPGSIKFIFTFLAICFFATGQIDSQETLKTFIHEGQQLQVYPTDYGTRVPWGPPNDASGATSASDGSTNTQTITGKYDNWYQGNYAAKVCADLNAFGYSDWYLPSRGELQSLYRSRNEIGGLSNALYWSSTDDTWGAEAVAVDLNGGFALSRYKNETSFVRCIRRVEPDRQSEQQVSIAGIKPNENLEKQIENALMDFHNQFLPGTDYKQSINYPKSPEYYYAWTSLVIAVGQDIAIILSAGKSEVYVKKSELGIKAVDYTATGAKIIKAIDGELLETAIEIAAAKAAEKGIQEITTSNLSVPWLRSGVAVVGVYNAAIKEEKIINEAINEQLELQQIANDLAPAINNMLGLINKLTSAGKISEYLHILESMIERKAELTVYRQMQFDRNRTAIFGIEGMILREMDYNLALRVAEGSQTPIAHRQVLPFSIGYAEGNINREGLDFQIKDFIDQNKPFMETSSYVDRVFRSVRRQLDPLERARRDINSYGGSLMHSHLHVNSYQELVNLIGSIDAGVRGRVTGTHGIEGLRTYALVVVTDKEISKIYGESTIDASNNYYIPNLPKDKPLYVHFLHAYKVHVTEEITVSDWVDRNLIVRVDTYRGGNLSRQLGQSILGLVGVAGHYAEIYIQGQNLQAEAALFQKIHYLRLLGQWEVHGRVVDTSFGELNFSGGGNITFNEDGTGTAPMGDKFYWRSHYKRTGIIRSHGIRTGVEYHLVITMSSHEDFYESGEIFASIYHDSDRYRMTWGESESFTKVKEAPITSTKSGTSTVPKIVRQQPVVKEKESGTFTDPRNGQAYKWVRIGDQVWMAENLNYATRSGSWCYDDRSANCEKYGRLYNWEAAMNACPPGWRLSSDFDWSTLRFFLWSTPGTKLKSKNGWLKNRNGTDDYGFSALPGGARNLGGGFQESGNDGAWWLSTEYTFSTAWFHYIKHSVGDMSRNYSFKSFGFSVRCVRNN